MKKMLDSSKLIGHWRKSCGKSLSGKTTADARAWARKLIQIYQTNEIVTPVYVEVVAGVTSKHELQLTRAYLDEFDCIDEGRITPEDWENAIRLAQRVPKDKKRRQLGDCLIRAIADRLHRDVETPDQGFPH